MSEPTIITHFNELQPGEHERLAVLSEELGEAIQAIGKIMRHGYRGKYDNGLTNREQLCIELADVQWAIETLKSWSDISHHDFEQRIKHRCSRNNYLHHKEER